jgi:hypothetical protein
MDGSIITLPLTDLPKDIPYVVVNDKIADYLQEDEIVLLPGVIKVESHANKICGKYEMYNILVNNLKGRTEAGQKGGKAGFTKQNKDLAELLGIPRLSLRNKVAIFYRQIHNRHVEVLNWRCFPKTNAEVDSYMRDHIVPLEQFYERTLHLYPDYKDLWIAFNAEKDSQKRRELNKKLMSYTVMMAVYNKKTNEIEHYHYGIFESMLSEADLDVTSRKEEITMRIKEYVAGILN